MVISPRLHDTRPQSLVDSWTSEIQRNPSQSHNSPCEDAAVPFPSVGSIPVHSSVAVLVNDDKEISIRKPMNVQNTKWLKAKDYIMYVNVYIYYKILVSHVRSDFLCQHSR